MRERLVAAFVSVTLLTVVVFAVVRAYALSDLIEDEQQDRVQRSARLVAEAVTAHGTPDASYLRELVAADEEVRFTAPGTSPVVAAGPGWSARGGPVTATSDVAGGGEVSVSRSRAAVDRAVSDALLPVVLLGIGLVVLAGLVALALARRLSRPFLELAGAARQVGSGRLGVELPHYAVPEADAIARALERSGTRVRETLASQQAFLLDASHELRTPLTALRLELEELSLADGLPAGAGDQLVRSLTEVERLDAAVEAMLAATRRRAADEVDVAALALAAADRWRAVLARSGCDLAVDAVGPAPVRGPAGAVEQLLDGLVDALAGGASGTAGADGSRSGRCTLEVRDLGDHVRVRVVGAVEGTGTDALRAAAEALGGHLTGDRSSSTLLLPRA